MAELPAIAANAVLPAAALEVLQAQRIHPLRIPDLLHRLRAHVADDELAAPVEETRADQAVRIHRIAVEDVGAGIGVADILLIDALADLDAGMSLDVELRPARREILDKDTVAMIAERVEEFLALCVGDELARNLDDDLAIASVVVKPFDVVDEFPEIELEAGELQVGFLGHAVDRDVDLVDSSLEDRPHAVGRNKRAVGGGIDIIDPPRALRVGDHVGKPLVQQRLAVLVHAQHLERLVELGKVIDDLPEHIELHHALEAPGLGDHVAMAGGAERALEIAGARGVGEDDERRRQRDDRLQRRAPLQIDSRFETSFHAGSLRANGACPMSYRTMVNRD